MAADTAAEAAAPEEQPDRFSNPLEARKKAMDYLARREYGQQELCKKLTEAGFDEKTAAAAVDRLTRDGLQDDRRFTESFLKSRANQGKGPVRVRMELEQRGISGSMLDEALDDCGEDWFALARSVRQKKFGDEPPGEFREKARQMRFLQYRGFDPEHIRAAFVSEES